MGLREGRLRYGAGVALAAMFALFLAYTTTLKDPSLRPDAFPPGDRRAHRYGSRTAAETNALIEDLRAARNRQANPVAKTAISVELSDVFVARRMWNESLVELEEARRLAPSDPQVLVREALVLHAEGHDTDAMARVAEAEAASPGDPAVARAKEFLLTREDELKDSP